MLFRRLPLIEGVVTFIHVLGFIAFVAVLWCVHSGQYFFLYIQDHIRTLVDLIANRATGPRDTASNVFTEFESNGWPTTGLACLVGLNGPLPYLSGADSSVHLAEELRNSAWGLPRSMLLTALTNYVTSFIVVGQFTIDVANFNYTNFKQCK